MYITFRFKDSPTVRHEARISSLAVVPPNAHITFETVSAMDDFWERLTVDDGLKFAYNGVVALTTELTNFEMLFAHTVNS